MRIFSILTGVMLLLTAVTDMFSQTDLERFKSNVAIVSTNGSVNPSFFVYDGVETGKIFFVTAAHVLDSGFQVPNAAIRMTMKVNDSSYVTMGNVVGVDEALDLALIVVKKPEGYKWHNTFISKSKPRKESNLNFIGQNWYVPVNELRGRLNEYPSGALFQIDFPTVPIRPGNSGAPVFSKRSITGMLFATAEDNPYDALKIESIEERVGKWLELKSQINYVVPYINFSVGIDADFTSKYWHLIPTTNPDKGYGGTAGFFVRSDFMTLRIRNKHLGFGLYYSAKLAALIYSNGTLGSASYGFRNSYTGFGGRLVLRLPPYFSIYSAYGVYKSVNPQTANLDNNVWQTVKVVNGNVLPGSYPHFTLGGSFSTSLRRRIIGSLDLGYTGVIGYGFLLAKNPDDNVNYLGMVTFSGSVSVVLGKIKGRKLAPKLLFDDY